MTALVDIRGVTRTFAMPDGETLEILKGIDLRVEPGEHVAIVGRSGTGKSTLLNILGLLDKPTSGYYVLDDQDTSRMGETRRAKLRGRTFGFVFQSFNLIPGLNTTENVAAPLLYSHGTAFWTRTKRAEELLTAVGLEAKIGARVDRMSGGEQQRVAIARALARRPRVILADEPTGALDVDTGNAVMELLERQCSESGSALIMITHDLAVAARASTQYRLDHGVLTRIEVSSHKMGSLEEFQEVIPGMAPPAAAPAQTAPTAIAPTAAPAQPWTERRDG
ncbi:ABC transporter ATP-binding protein [Actinomyces slackii]|uniref:Macrolide export ATP-binding/permease protein MacB n=1 Tax=Actinomyces slackii TaxID=52774 RepID=A0A3S4UNE3_9ACTO|nr:ABC transporter ATP-binding protein [Actinomyces slackii]VEG74563.1 Macrolide export ATP-binding/permease protein MacB [Actinomyces slackii]